MSDTTVERAPHAAPAPVVSPRELAPDAIFAAVLMLVAGTAVTARNAPAAISAEFARALRPPTRP